MKMNKSWLILFGILALVLLVVFGGLFSITGGSEIFVEYNGDVHPNYDPWINDAGDFVVTGGGAVRILDYVISVGKTDSGIDDDGDFRRDCFFEATITRNGEVVDFLDDSYYENVERDYDYLNIHFNTQSRFIFNECKWLMNRYRINIPEDSISVNITNIDDIYLQNQDISFDVVIDNNFSDGLLVDLVVEYEVPTFIGSAVNVVTRSIVLPLGETTESFSIEADIIADSLIITPTLEIFVPGSSFENVNTHCDYLLQSTGDWEGIVDVFNYCEKISIGSYEGLPQTVLTIVPNPISYELTGDECDDGYYQEGIFCIRDDVADLTCIQTGCPQINGSNYYCTSSGLCAETITIYLDCTNDVDCSDYGVYMVCDENSGACVDNRLIVDLGECLNVSDCLLPCPEMSVTCNKLGSFGYCSYEGVCEVQNYEDVVSINVVEKKSRNYTGWLVFGFVFLALIIIFSKMRKK